MLQSCDTDDLFVITPKAIFAYALIVALSAVLVAMRSKEKKAKTFWIWFLISFLFTPVAGFTYFVLTFTNRSQKAE